MAEREARRVTVGRVVGLFGVRGWLRVYSYTDPRTNLIAYTQWYLRAAEGWLPARLEDGRQQGKGLIAKIEGVDDRDHARAWLGAEIAISRDELPDPGPGEYYWIDLEGLRVRTLEGTDLGTVSHLFETGANDVLVVHGDRERLVPFTLDHVVQRIDWGEGLIEVDWDPEL